MFVHHAFIPDVNALAVLANFDSAFRGGLLELGGTANLVLCDLADATS